MCYSAEVSFGTFGFVALVAGYLWVRNRGLDHPIALILLAVSAMQLVEGALWLTDRCGPLKQALTAAIPIVLALQPVALNWIVHSWNAGWAAHYDWVAAAAGIGLLRNSWETYKTYGKCTRISPAGNLEWPNIPDKSSKGAPWQFLYYAAMLYPLVTLKNTTFAILYTTFSTISWLNFQPAGNSFGSLWCHFVNLLAVFALIT